MYLFCFNITQCNTVQYCSGNNNNFNVIKQVMPPDFKKHIYIASEIGSTNYILSAILHKQFDLVQNLNTYDF